MSTLPRGVCPVCGQERQLTKAGVMRYHRAPRDQYPFRGIVCKGVDQPPKSVAADPITAAEKRGYARAIADLRDVQRYLDWDAASRFLGHPLLTDNQMLAAIAYLESIAPGRTTP